MKMSASEIAYVLFFTKPQNRIECIHRIVSYERMNVGIGSERKFDMQRNEIKSNDHLERIIIMYYYYYYY